ncbi:hypothetical protein P7K49_001612 [Saguinus oedipus]|uniref:Uncharacterized protein n=1 Tax=Saguinus oedipus TaxID=9490 RepID=A0ABQ9WEZ9_SAGOE|nr:hypothetical protein P7K49_001612 [Saguinus oedipus]
MQNEIGHGEVCKALPPLSLPGLLALSLRQKQLNRWMGFATVGIRNPCSSGELPFLLYVPSYPIQSNLGNPAAEATQETVESLMQKFKESFRANTPIEIGQLQPALRSASAGKRKRRSKSRDWEYLPSFCLTGPYAQITAPTGFQPRTSVMELTT